MTALEGLLLSNPGEDNLRLEFAEKITFLIGDSEEWLAYRYNARPQDGNSMSSWRKAEARIALAKRFGELYEKRFGFVYKNISKENENNQITPDDYTLILSILRWVSMMLLKIEKKGIKSISKESENIPYLDGYIETLKYGGSSDDI
jgi:hypothetical protein